MADAAAPLPPAGKPPPLPPAGEAPLFWHVLVYYPCLFALVAGGSSCYLSALPVRSWDFRVFSEAYLLACLPLASLQCLAPKAYARRVEGDLGYPQWVHRLAGLGEAGVVGLRVFALVERSEVPRALATVLTGPMLGGAAFTWLYALQKPRHGTPALLVFLATWLTRSRKIRATAECYSITIVFGACAAALIRWRTGPRKKRKKKTAAKEE